MPNCEIEEVDGVGPDLGARFRQAGIADSDALLAAARTPAQRQALAASTGATEALILQLANRVDLYRVHGVGLEFGVLLEAAGVASLNELIRRNPETLAKRIAARNQEQDIVRHVPEVSSVVRWVEHAKTLKPLVE